MEKRVINRYSFGPAADPRLGESAAAGPTNGIVANLGGCEGPVRLAASCDATEARANPGNVSLTSARFTGYICSFVLFIIVFLAPIEFYPI